MRSPGVSGRIVCVFRTEIHFADTGFFLVASHPGWAEPPLAKALRLEAEPDCTCRLLKCFAAGLAD